MAAVGDSGVKTRGSVFCRVTCVTDTLAGAAPRGPMAAIGAAVGDDA